MELFYKILLSEEVFKKMNIFGFIFEKIQIWSKNPKISFRQLKVTLAEGGYKTKISIKLLLDVKLIVTIWMEPNIAIFIKVQSGFLT